MSLLDKLKEFGGKLKDKAEEFVGGALGAASFKSSSPKDYGSDFDIKISINSKEIKIEDAIITGVMVDSGMPPEAGICEIHMKVLGYKIEDGKLKINEDFAKMKLGQPIVIEIANSFSGPGPADYQKVFTGFVEKTECEIDNDGSVNFVVYGMDAKMWMMSNNLTEMRGEGKSYEQIVKSVIGNYSSQAKIGQISLRKNVQIKSKVYQVGQSDYEFLCKLADLTGSLFYVDPEGKINFSAPSKLMKPMNTITLAYDAALSIKFSASVWGTPQSVKVTSIDPSNPSKTISATCNSVQSIGSGKASKQVVPQNYSSERKGIRYVNITDNSVENKEQAQARADAEYSRRNLKFVETELLLKGNPKMCVGQGIKLKDFGDPFDNECLVARVSHLWGDYSKDNMLQTKVGLVANRF